MIQKSVNKLLATSKSEPDHHVNTSANSDSQLETSDMSMFSDAKSEQLDVASQDVKLGIHSLVTAIRVALDSTDNSSTHGRQVQPVVQSAFYPCRQQKQLMLYRQNIHLNKRKCVGVCPLLT